MLKIDSQHKKNEAVYIIDKYPRKTKETRYFWHKGSPYSVQPKTEQSGNFWTCRNCVKQWSGMCDSKRVWFFVCAYLPLLSKERESEKERVNVNREIWFNEFLITLWLLLFYFYVFFLLLNLLCYSIMHEAQIEAQKWKHWMV